MTITFHVPDEAGVTRTAIEGLGIAYRNADGQWQWLNNAVCNAGAKTLTVEVDHFCEFSMLEGFQLIPISANVQVNETLPLQVMTCKSPDKEDDVLASLVYKPYPVEDISVSASKWSVNDVLGGNATLGTITGSGLSATFTAPATQPDPKTVAASVELNELGHQEKILLFSLITIGQEGYHGEFQVSATGPIIAWTGTGEATWTLNDEGEFDISGTITPDEDVYPIGDCNCTLDERTKSFENMGQVRDWTDPPTVYWVIPTLIWSATCV
ncbi:MAG: hypothetical protein QM299_03145 [Pseudomonadota bacterium]|nr:hypothetical protein [Pseudomonadota bacterium]HPD22679.1 hypothetical protein [Deltaproteobacteria bacterium]